MKIFYTILLTLITLTSFSQIPSWFDIDNVDIRKNMSTVNDYGVDTSVGLFVVNRDTNGISSMCLILGDSAEYYRCTHVSKDSTWTSTNVTNLDVGGDYSPWDSLSGNVFLKDITDSVGIGTATPDGKFEVLDANERLLLGYITAGPFKLPFQGFFGKSSIGKTHQIGHFDLSQVSGGEVSNFSIRDSVFDQTGSGLGIRYGQTYLNSYDSTINAAIGTGKRYEYGHTTYGNGVGIGTEGHADIYCFDRDKNVDITAVSAYHDVIAMHQYIDTTAGNLSSQALRFSLGGNMQIGMAYGSSAFSLDRVDFVIDTVGNVGIGTSNPQGILQVGDSTANGFGGFLVKNTLAPFGLTDVPLSSYFGGTYADLTALGLGNGLSYPSTLTIGTFAFGANNGLAAGNDSRFSAVLGGLNNYIGGSNSGIIASNNSNIGGGATNNSAIIGSDRCVADSALTFIASSFECGTGGDHATVLNGFRMFAHYYHQIAWGSQGIIDTTGLGFNRTSVWNLNNKTWTIGNGGVDEPSYSNKSNSITQIANGNLLLGTHLKSQYDLLDSNSAILTVLNDSVGLDTILVVKNKGFAPIFTVKETGVQITNGTQADGYVLTSDASGNATWQDPTAYGEMGFGDSTRTIALTQNVFSVVTNSNNTLWSTAAVDLHNVTYSGDSLIVDSAGTYQVNVQLSMDGTNGSVIRLGVFLNGVLACSCTGYEELSNNKIIQLSYINIDALNAGDVLQVVITNTANNDDVDAIGGKLMVNKIR